MFKQQKIQQAFQYSRQDRSSSTNGLQISGSFVRPYIGNMTVDIKTSPTTPSSASIRNYDYLAREWNIGVYHSIAELDVNSRQGFLGDTLRSHQTNIELGKRVSHKVHDNVQIYSKPFFGYTINSPFFIDNLSNKENETLNSPYFGVMAGANVKIGKLSIDGSFKSPIGNVAKEKALFENSIPAWPLYTKAKGENMVPAEGSIQVGFEAIENRLLVELGTNIKFDKSRYMMDDIGSSPTPGGGIGPGVSIASGTTREISNNGPFQSVKANITIWF
jgi:hypothetical protein